jgi:signal transduction histidine kinase/putative methionine-R-sulfoxide reductase with GAF domain
MAVPAIVVFSHTNSRFHAFSQSPQTLKQNVPATLELSLHTLAEISELLARVTAREEIAAYVSQRLRALLGAELCGLVELSMDGKEATLIGAAGLSQELTEQFRHYPFDHPSPIRDAVTTGGSVYLEDINEWSMRYPTPPATSFTGARVALPLITDNKILGGLTLTFAEARRFSDHEREVLNTVAHHCGTALQRARLFEQHAQNTAWLTRLHAITASLSAALSKSDVARIIGEHLIETLGAVMTGILELSEDGRDLVLIHALNWSDDQHRHLARFPVDTPLPLRDAVRSRAPVFLENIHAWVNAGYVAPPGTLSASPDGGRVALPLLIGEQVIGVLSLTYSTPQKFSVSDREFLMAVANQCAQAIERARLYDAEHAARVAAEQFAGRTELLQRVASALAGAMTRAQVASATTEQIQEWIKPEASAVIELSEDGMMLRVLHAEGLRNPHIRESCSLNTQIPAADVIRTGSAIYFASPAEWQARYPSGSIVGEKRNALAALPLMVERRAIGALSMSFAEARTFSEDDCEFFEAFANQCAVALERARLYETEQEARARAENANAAKSQFLGIMSHELRTPLNAVIGYADLLLMEVRGSLNEEQKLQVQRIRSSAWHQLGLIEEILAYARIEAGREEVRAGEVDVREILNETAALVRPETERKQIDLRIALADGDVVINTDGAKLRQIMLNLAGNAAKFTTHGFVEVGARRSSEEIICYVQDSGPGIPSDKLEMIWQPFTQVDQSDTRVVGGTGLGLAIARRLTHLLGGRLTVKSVFGSGSLFELKLPLH